MDANKHERETLATLRLAPEFFCSPIVPVHCERGSSCHLVVGSQNFLGGYESRRRT